MKTESWAASLQRPDGVLISQVVGQALLVTLNRPQSANALDAELMDALSSLWSVAAATPQLRCVLITGSGSAFCSGADVSMLSVERSQLGDSAAAELAFVPGQRLAVPVITLVNGVCAGGGLHFVADADICLAGEDARFLDPHVSVGQVSALEPLLLRSRVRRDVITRMVLLGRHEQLSAQDARRAASSRKWSRAEISCSAGWSSQNLLRSIRLKRSGRVVGYFASWKNASWQRNWISVGSWCADIIHIRMRRRAHVLSWRNDLHSG